eukprot:jgi/Hompol1/7042/HPOL_001912-RA
MKSSVRAYFKENALETDDAVLFTISMGKARSIHSTSNNGSPTGREPNTRPTSDNPRETNATANSETGSIATLPEFYFEAVYYASDDDFLMKSSVRAYFKENALETDDAVLFTISMGTDPSRLSEQHPALLNFAYSVSENEADRTAFRRLNTSWLLRWLIIAYAIAAIVIVKFFVPVQYIYVVSFIFIFFFCLILIVCI